MRSSVWLNADDAGETRRISFFVARLIRTCSSRRSTKVAAFLRFSVKLGVQGALPIRCRLHRCALPIRAMRQTGARRIHAATTFVWHKKRNCVPNESR